MSIKDLSKEDLELFSHKDLTNMLLSERGTMNTAELFKEITTILGLPNSVYENKIGDYYTTLTTDKRFIMLEDGKWDLRDNHTSDKVVVMPETEEEELDEDELEEEELKDENDIDEENDDDFDATRADDEFDDPTDEDLKDLVILDEDELELEE